MPKLRTLLTTLTVGALGALLLIPVAAQGATNFGSRLLNEPTENTCEGVGDCTIVSRIHPSDPEGAPYSGGAPVSGVITKFRYLAWASETAGQITFRVANLSLTDPNSLDNALATSAGTGPTVTVQPSEDPETPILEVGGRLPVQAGQYLAADVSPSIGIIYNSDGSKRSYVFAPPLVDGAGQRGSTMVANELLVAATIEPDADGDGFGDETQDACPSQPTTQGACDLTPPTVSGLKVSGGKNVSYRLSEAATVSLKLEKKSPGRRVGKKCVRPTKANKGRKKCARFRQVGKAFSGPGSPGQNKVKLPGKKLRPGTYRLTITVRDSAGNQTTKTTTFVVKAKKRKRGGR